MLEPREKYTVDLRGRGFVKIDTTEGFLVYTLSGVISICAVSICQKINEDHVCEGFAKKMSWEILARMKGNAREIFGVSLALSVGRRRHYARHDDQMFIIYTPTEFATLRQRRLASGPLVKAFVRLMLC